MSSDGLASRVARLTPDQRAALAHLLSEQSGDPPSGLDATADGPRNETERLLKRVWLHTLGVDAVGVHDSFFALGGDSISSLQISARATSAGLHVTSRQVLELETIARLAEVAVAAGVAPHRSSDELGSTVLTPIQRWFFEQNLPESHHWDQAVFVDVRENVDEDVLRRALAVVVTHHDVLRSTFTRTEDGWSQQVHADLDLRPQPPQRRDELVRAATASVQADIDLARGPLFGAVLIRSRDEIPDQLPLVVHHLVVDGVSMRLLVDDLETSYRQLRAGNHPSCR